MTLTAADDHQFNLTCYRNDSDIAIILLHEIFGMTPFIHRMCQYWCSQGFTVVAPALYDRLEKNLSFPYTAIGYQRALYSKNKVLNWDNQLLDIQSTVQTLLHEDIKHIITLGYSWGGTLSWLVACRLHPIQCVISYYGTHIHQFSKEQPKCQTLLHVAEHDDLVPKSMMEKLCIDHSNVQLRQYAATHGFRCEDWQGNSDQQYDAQCSALADKNTLAFIQQNTINN